MFAVVCHFEVGIFLKHEAKWVMEKGLHVTVLVCLELSWGIGVCIEQHVHGVPGQRGDGEISCSLFGSNVAMLTLA